jgi:hypothetical protein
MGSSHIGVAANKSTHKNTNPPFYMENLKKVRGKTTCRSHPNLLQLLTNGDLESTVGSQASIYKQILDTNNKI